MITLKHLRYFVALAENKNQINAAEQLHITRQTISSAIKDIENEIGKKLFESKGGSKTELTPVGKIFYKKALRLLNDFDELIYDAHHFSEEFFSVSINNNILTILPELKYLLLNYSQVNSYVRIDMLDNDNQDSVFNDIITGKSYCGIVMSMSPFHDPRCWSISLIELPVYAILSKEHDLSDKKEISYSELLDYPVICFGNAEKFYQPLVEEQHKKHDAGTFICEPQIMKASNLMVHNPQAVMLTAPVADMLSRYTHLRMIPVTHAFWNIALIGPKEHFTESICKDFGYYLKEELHTLFEKVSR